MFNLVYLLDLEWSLSQTFYLAKSKSTRATLFRLLPSNRLKSHPWKIACLLAHFVIISVDAMLQRHFTQFGVSSRNNVARDGSNYLRPEIWPVDHIVNCGIQYTLYTILEYSPTRAAHIITMILFCKIMKLAQTKIRACILPKMDSRLLPISKCSMYYSFRSFW